MKLTDLVPHWVQPGQWAEQSPPFYIGVSFKCPKCSPGPCPTCGYNSNRRLAVSFWPPIDPTRCQKKYGFELPHDGYADRLRGETFATLSLEQIVTIGHDNPKHRFRFKLRDGVLEEII